MHRYIETLVKGQVAIGREVAVLDRIQASGDFQVGMGHRLVADEPPGTTDVLHLHFAWSARPFLRHHGKSRDSGMRLYHFHGPWAAEGLAQGQGYLNALAKWLYEESVYRRQRRFVCTSTAFASRLRRTYGIR